MGKTIVLFSLVAVLAACATEQPTTGVQRPAEATKKVCKMVEDDATGTKISTRQVCERVPVDASDD
jgi:hypothetical protein